MWGKVRLLRLLGMITLVLIYFLGFPLFSEAASYWIGCSTGNFQPSNTCNRICRMLNNNQTQMTSCCYGVNHAGRSACSCCSDAPECPLHCAEFCVMISINAEQCTGNVPGVLPTSRQTGSVSIIDSLIASGVDLIPVDPKLNPSSMPLIPFLKNGEDK